jgi:myo-inositol catabolism protein IolC
MNKKEIIKQLNEASYWIIEVSNQGTDNNGSDEPHIKDMLDGIQNAVVMLSSNTIEVDISFYHPDDNETIKVYDEEGMREEFENKLKQLI